jgi:peptidoglycan/xylan/chitin deacetylase (PgdA/CDA1 family)
LKEGVPELLKIFEAQDSHCTFFVSMGKAFKRSYTLSEKLKKKVVTNSPSLKGRFSVYYILGFYNSLVAFLMNPIIGGKYHKTLKNVIAKGHELGLHGGRNHASWERDANKWTVLELQDEIEYGLRQFEKQGLPPPISFASPCWNAPEKLNTILENLQFKIVANQGSSLNYVMQEGNMINRFPTNVIGKNRQVGFIENLRALGCSKQKILQEFSKQLDNEESFKMVFDHPFYAGIHELQTVEGMINIAKEKGYIIDSLKNIYQQLAHESTSHLS